MGKLRFAKVISLPQTPNPGTIYIVPKQNGTANLVITNESDGGYKIVEGFTSDQIKSLSLLSVLTNINVSDAIDVVASDNVLQAIGKLQAQAKLFGQGVEGQAIFSATQFTSVPVEFKSLYIFVTQPHLRMMVWTGTRYVRAPWHQPGVIAHSYGESLEGYLPVRADISYQQENYPDLASYLGLSGIGTFTLVEARGEFLRVLDNGRGVDVGRGIRTFQGDTIRNISGKVFGYTSNSWNARSFGYASGAFATDATGTEASAPMDQTTTVNGGALTFNAALQVPTSNENRPRNIAFPLWVSY